MSSFIGIDLGTTFSAIATIDETGRPIIVHNSEGQNITPSCVTENEEGNFEVGEYARKTWGSDPNKAAARFKRDMGTKKVFKINSRDFTPTELSAFVLKKVVKDASLIIGEIGEAVVTIPANFSNEAREATMAAARAAGLNIRYIINEPTAAALYYSFKHNEKLHGNYAVYDLGGGTFDISIISVQGQNVNVVASNGVSKLGGDDFDDAMISIVQKKYKELRGENLEIVDYTKNHAEEDKKSLSKRKSIQINVNRQIIEVTRAEFEEAISTLVAQTEMLCESSIDEAKINTSDIKAVLLAGGSTRIPVIQESIKRIFGKEPVATVNVDEVVALGASLYSVYKGEKSELSAAQKNTIQKIKVTESTSKYYGTIILNHDEARGEEILYNNILINKGDKIPCSLKKTFYTICDGQEAVDCQLTEASAPETDPRFVNIIWEGKLELPAGRPAGQEIEVTYSYDENQMMKCSFVDVATGRKKEVDLSIGSIASTGNKNLKKFIVE